MGTAFEQAARAAGIANARWLRSDWESAAVDGDVILLAHVTYFVSRIGPFVRKLHAAARRRVLIITNVTPPPNQGAALFSLLRGEEQQPVPGFRQLLPVLWELGLTPDVRVLGAAPATSLGGALPSRAEAIETAVAGAGPERRAVAAAALEARFEEFFDAAPEGFRRKPSGDSRMMLVTWEKGADRP
jgi:hypothetical protein